MGSTHKKLGKMADNNEKKSRVFSKLVRLIQVESRKCGGDQNSPGLKAAIEKARKENMPNENIERAIKKTDGLEMTPIIFEFYGPGGVGIIATGLTDSINRTSQEMRHLLDVHETSLGVAGSVSWNFTKSPEGEWVAKMKTKLSEDDLEKLSNLTSALEDRDDIQDVYTSVE